MPSASQDPAHIESRLLVVAEMLDRAVAEVHRAMEEVRRPHSAAAGPPEDHPETDGSTDDHQ